MEMDIYMRRRLVALGGLVLFFIFFVLLVKSCGGDDDTAPIEPAATGATGEGGAVALDPEAFRTAADDICAQANSAVGALDPTDPDAIREEHQITASELEQLQGLQVDDDSRVLAQFFGALEDVVAALRSKQVATQRGDTASADEAQLAIDEAEVEARTLGDRYGFRDCGQFLDAGQAPGEAATGTDTGGEVAPETGGVAPTTTPTTPTDTGTPPADDTGGVTPEDTGGVTP